MRLHLLVNILLGFALPWFFGVRLWRKDRRLLLTIAPFSIVVAHVIDLIGFHYEFWDFQPIVHKLEAVSTLPVEFGFDAIMGCYAVRNARIHADRVPQVLTLFALTATVLEGLGVMFDWVIYDNGWNMFWTFVSYWIAFLIVYGYDRLLERTDGEADSPTDI